MVGLNAEITLRFQNVSGAAWMGPELLRVRGEIKVLCHADRHVLVIQPSFTFTIIPLIILFLGSVKTVMAVTEKNVRLIQISMEFRPLG